MTPPLPFEFVIEGVPVSAQTKDRRRLSAWRHRVRQVAQDHWDPDRPPILGEVSLRITQFYDGEAPDMDADNIIKPIQDALAGLVYRNDSQVRHTSCIQSSVNGAFRVKGR